MKLFFYFVAALLICLPSLTLDKYGESITYFSILFSGILIATALLNALDVNIQTVTWYHILIENSDYDTAFLWIPPAISFLAFANLSIVNPHESYWLLGILSAITIPIIIVVFAYLSRLHILIIDKNWNFFVVMCIVIILAGSGVKTPVFYILILLLSSIITALPISNTKRNSRWVFWTVYVMSLLISIHIHPTLFQKKAMYFTTIALNLIITYVSMLLFSMLSMFFHVGAIDCESKEEYEIE